MKRVSCDAGGKRGRGEDGVITINVGGTLFQTLQMTLTQHESMLSRITDDEQVPFARDANGHVFLDRDPILFKYTLFFLRINQLHHDMKTVVGLAKNLYYEAQYLALEPLMNILKPRATVLKSVEEDKAVWEFYRIDGITKTDGTINYLKYKIDYDIYWGSTPPIFTIELENDIVDVEQNSEIVTKYGFPYNDYREFEEETLDILKGALPALQEATLKYLMDKDFELYGE